MNEMPRAVFDTNIWISRELRGGVASHCIQAVNEGRVALFYCRPMIAELARKLQEVLGYNVDIIRAILYEYRRLGTLVEIEGLLHVVEADTDDDKFLECALVASAGWIVSRDKHLLDLKSYNGIQIVKPHEFLASLNR
jgi:putative PIN family toxin of toxin-antitoxin system